MAQSGPGCDAAGAGICPEFGLASETNSPEFDFHHGFAGGGVTAFCGPIGFVGVAVPHLARALSNTSRHQTLTWLCLLCGASLMLLCDLVAKGPGVSYNFPINAVTALIGSPILIGVILKSQYGRQFF
ncbi:MAG: iron ABC transporter permease [Microscillaceae bacterium]|nr:iron ABC transporter permease [Microscillaceae bacterium]